MKRTLRCVPFSQENLYQEIKQASRASWPPEHSGSANQINYLASYLAHEDAAAQTILVEAPYTDRHYLEEYGRYYANTLTPPPHQATRLHFFRSEWTDKKIDALVLAIVAGTADHPEQQSALGKDYLGFVVVRPLPSVPIGVTARA